MKRMNGMNLGSIMGRSERSVIVAGAVAALVLGVMPAASAAPSETGGVSSEAEVTPMEIPPTKVTEFNHADPTAIQYNGKIYSYATDGSSVPATCTLRCRIRVIVADSGSPLGPYLRRGKVLSKIPWSNGSPVMGPHVVHKGGTRFHMYFAARKKGTGEPPRCIGVAVSLNGPRGPFVPRESHLACDDAHNGAIAPDLFRDPATGKNYLLYKTNGPDAVRRAWIQGLGPDGLAKDGNPRTLLGARNVNYENPQMIRSGGKYFLFMSRNGYRTVKYNTTVNWSTSPRGPFPADRARTLMSRFNTSVAGPASAEIVEVNGVSIIFFHGWNQNGGGCNKPRFMYVARIVWGANLDNPHLAVPNTGNATC